MVGAMSMLTRRLRASILGLAVLATAPLVAACDSELTATEVPADGVTLRYDLQPGAVYSGHVTQRETAGTAGQAVNRRLDFDVQIAVLEETEDGKFKVKAVVKNLNMEWALPPAAQTIMNVDDFVAGMTKRLEGVSIPFSVTPKGKVTDVPPLPPELNEQESLAANAVIDGLTRAFFVVPEESLQNGQTWTDEDTRGRKGKLGRYSEWTTTNKFEGLYEYKPTDGGGGGAGTVAKLTIESDKTEVTTTKEGGHETKTRSKTEALFNLDGGYLAKVEATDTKYDGPEMTTVKFSANFKRAGGGAAAPAAPAEPQTQAITDPCDADYVGGEECKEDAAGDDATAEGDDESEDAEGDDGDEKADAEGDAKADAEG